MQTRRFHLHAVHRHGQMGVVDGDDAAFGADQLDRHLPMAHVVEDRDVIDMLHAERPNLGNHILALVDHIIGAKLPYPRRDLRPWLSITDKKAMDLIK
jgi:hypothetical protein